MYKLYEDIYEHSIGVLLFCRTHILCGEIIENISSKRFKLSDDSVLQEYIRIQAILISTIPVRNRSSTGTRSRDSYFLYLAP